MHHTAHPFLSPIHHHNPKARLAWVAIVVWGTGCTAMTPQLPATDVAGLSTIEDRGDREQAYASQQIYTHREAQGLRYTKGTDPNAAKRSWQSLDAVLRSDMNAAAALPNRHIRTSRVLATLAIASGLVAISGFAASSRDGLDVSRLDGAGAMLMGGGVAALGFAVGSGIAYGRSRTGYQRAVEVYNDSVGMRMGLYTPNGQYIPGDHVLVDSEGFIVLGSPRSESTRPIAPPPPQPELQPAPPSPATPTVRPDIHETPSSPNHGQADRHSSEVESASDAPTTEAVRPLRLSHRARSPTAGILLPQKRSHR
ncbi:MAG: hypothetical protein V3V08_02510 [Nannocystaceae bacterium]